jgi:hypothetical protein
VRRSRVMMKSTLRRTVGLPDRGAAHDDGSHPEA